MGGVSNSNEKDEKTYEFLHIDEHRLLKTHWFFHILIAILSKLCKNLEFSILFGGGASAKIGCDFASTKCIATAFFINETRCFC